MTFDSELTERFIQISPRVIENSTSSALSFTFALEIVIIIIITSFFLSRLLFFGSFLLLNNNFRSPLLSFFYSLFFGGSNLMKNILLPNWSHKSVFQAIAKWCHNKKHLLHLTNAQWNQNNIFHHSLLTLITILLWKFSFAMRTLFLCHYFRWRGQSWLCRTWLQNAHVKRNSSPYTCRVR